MLRARLVVVLLYAVATAPLCGCFGPRVGAEAPAGASLAGNWKLDPAASDDPLKTLSHMRAEAAKIIERNNANSPTGGGGPAGGPAADDPGARGPRRDPLARSPMAHIIQDVMGRGEYLSVRETPQEVVFDYGSYHRSFTPGAHSVVSAEGGVGDQSSGWKGRQYVIYVKPQNGPEVTETYSLSEDGKQLSDKVHVSSYELPAVELTRIYRPTTASSPRALPTGD
jgi:hypothetical protein